MQKVPEMVMLVSHGADMKEAKLSPLLYAILRRDFVTARNLYIEKKVDVNAYSDAKILTPLLAAIECRNFDMCQLLLTHGADGNASTVLLMSTQDRWSFRRTWKERRMTPLRKAILQVMWTLIFIISYHPLILILILNPYPTPPHHSYFLLVTGKSGTRQSITTTRCTTGNSLRLSW